VTRLLAEAAAALGLEVLTSETHGMAQRGGTVVSMVKVGLFKGPLIPAGAADVGLFLHRDNLEVHRFYLKPGARVFVNAAAAGDYDCLDALGLASRMGAPVTANLVLLGYAVGQGGLFCGGDLLEQVIREKTPARFLDSNLRAFESGLDAAAAKLGKG
jgi:indolepyruvate ferredoxin oxidoreductase beta subunit